MNNLEDLAPWAESFINSLSPKEQKALYRKVALALRKQNQKRLSKQENPDGTKWEPRKKRIDKKNERKEGKVAKQKKMMLGLRKAKHMKVQANNNGATVGYTGRVSRIAKAHHYGLSERGKVMGNSITYPERQLLGVSDIDEEVLFEVVLGKLKEI
ncbi:phage virion morphogenesis protein [Alteromonas sp. a30]|uniref:phage virion morphogenesis protein n=1 Tax=Alteromonas sp. a30 TaxID=2730917 RepID=UPI0022824C0C|nr:phage virion morphogenesis protein [Alteromonas sp. a30]MCY7297486.1 phage virion morphogenesis protein [Alteromonas sp. a30]